jgi:GTP-binding protein YchF
VPLSIGIVGLPNVGKSTLFTALTRNAVEASNYPFCTIDPNVGVVPIPDPRLARVAELGVTDEAVPATIEFVDIAGLVRGASTGEGLGNRFLANIRETDAICEVVRFFSDPDVAHVEGRVDPVSDVETVRTELVLADLATVVSARERLAKAVTNDRTLQPKLDVVSRIADWLGEGHRAGRLELTDDERSLAADLHLLTMKPMLYVANVDEDALGAELAEIDGTTPIAISAEIEAEIAELDDAEREEYLEELGLDEPSLDKLVRAAYALLGLHSFFSSGDVESRAWTIRRGQTAWEAAGVIHTDFQKGFVKTEVVAFDDLDRLGGIAQAKEAGKLRVEGRDYVVADGDVIRFRFTS